MSKLKHQNFDKLLKYLPKSKIKAGDGKKVGKYPLFTSSSKLSKFIDTATYEYTGLIFGSGGSASIHYCDEPFATSTDCFVTVKKDDDVELKYVYYFLKSNLHILEAGFKGAGLKHISKKYLSNIQIPILLLAEQQKIASFLTRIETLIQKREDSIQLLDELIKSTFLDMFGASMRSNDMEDWTIIGGMLTALTDYHANGSYKVLSKNVILKTEPDYALMVRTTDLENNNFDNNNIYINEFEYNFLSKSKVYGGEIIFSKIGSAGNVYLMPFLNRPVSLGMNAFLLRFNDSSNTIFIYHYLKSSFTTAIILSKVKGAVTKTITKNAVRTIKIPDIPKITQDKFASIVTKIEATKAKYQSSLEELNHLFNSSAQKAFKGELNLGNIEVIEKEISKEEAQVLDEDKVLELIQSGSFEAKDHINEKQNYDDIRDMVLKLMEQGKITQKFTDDKKMVLEAIT